MGEEREWHQNRKNKNNTRVRKWRRRAAGGSPRSLAAVDDLLGGVLAQEAGAAAGGLLGGQGQGGLAALHLEVTRRRRPHHLQGVMDPLVQWRELFQ